MKKKLSSEEKNARMESFVELTDAINENPLVSANAKINIINSPKEVLKDLDGNKTPYVLLIQVMAEMAAKYLLPSSCKLLLFFLSRKCYGNLVCISWKQIQAGTLMSRTTVSVAIKELLDQKVIKIERNLDDVDQRFNSYMVNPLMAWMGATKDRKSFIVKNYDRSDLELFPEYQAQQKISKNTKNISEVNA